MYFLSMMTAEEICSIIEARTKELGRDITNQELNELLTKAAIDRKKVIAMSENKEDMDIDLLAGNLREEGFTVRNDAEERRKNDKENK